MKKALTATRSQKVALKMKEIQVYLITTLICYVGDVAAGDVVDLAKEVSSFLRNNYFTHVTMRESTTSESENIFANEIAKEVLIRLFHWDDPANNDDFILSVDKGVKSSDLSNFYKIVSSGMGKRGLLVDIGDTL